MLFTQASDESTRPEVCEEMVAFLRAFDNKEILEFYQKDHKEILQNYLKDPTTLNLNLQFFIKDHFDGFFAILPKCKTLKVLNLRGLSMFANNAEKLAKVLPMTGIIELDLSGNNIDYLGIQKLAEVLPKTNLRILNLRANNMGDPGAAALERFLEDTKLTTLELEGNNISQEYLTQIDKIIKGNKLRPESASNIHESMQEK